MRKLVFAADALRQRIHLIGNVDEADAVIVLRPGPAHGTLTYDIIRRRDLAASRVTAAQTLVRYGDIQTLGEKLDRQRWNEYASGNRTIVVKSEQVGPAIPNRIADQIVRDLARL